MLVGLRLLTVENWGIRLSATLPTTCGLSNRLPVSPVWRNATLLPDWTRPVRMWLSILPTPWLRRQGRQIRPRLGQGGSCCPRWTTSTIISRPIADTPFVRYIYICRLDTKQVPAALQELETCLINSYK